ncbi:MAG TPA: M20/M25/M40 family metallo-hydrolase [Solirubrobacteraceae bacterium]|nr:M20/M25/M40 family metallo-hydrolase [Solirubrobacteraceae bacterium]
MDQRLLDDLLDWLRIPSISTGGGEPADLERAAAWVAQRVSAAGGEARVVATEGNPLAVGELRSAREGAPTVLIYGHYDVQSVGDPAAWTTPPFEPDVRGGRVYARGASDDKGNFLPLLHVACAHAAAGALPVNVRVLVEGEEETGGEAVAHWVRTDERGADCAIVFDSGMVDEHTPAITIGLRGMVMLHLQVRTAQRDMHSGVYGGSALNALHALHAMLCAVVPGPDGRLRDELRAGVAAPAQAERDSWARLPPGDEVLAAVGARPAYPGAGAEYYERNGAEPSLEINAIHAGEHRTVVPAVAHASVSQRLAPGQHAQEAFATLERLLRSDLPPGAELELSAELAEPSLFPPDIPAVALSAQALERAVGAPAAFVRTGGSIPVVAEFAARDIPAVVSGFGLEDDAYHAPDESFRLVALEQGAAAAHELYQALAAL